MMRLQGHARPGGAFAVPNTDAGLALDEDAILFSKGERFLGVFAENQDSDHERAFRAVFVA